MRDPNRIPEILKLVQESWERSPDLRLGQFVCNLAAILGKRDPFYLEDDELLKALRIYNASTDASQESKQVDK